MKTDRRRPPVETLPLVPLRDMVVFPHMMAPFVVGPRVARSARSRRRSRRPTKRLFLAAQRDPQLDEPKPEDIYEVGVVATVAQTLKLPNGHIKVMVEGVRRGRILAFERARRVPRRSRVEPLAGPLVRRRRASSDYMAQGARRSSSSTPSSRTTWPSRASPRPSRSTTPSASPTRSPRTSPWRPPRSRRCSRPSLAYERLQQLQDLLEVEIEKVNIDRRINNKVKKQMEKAQKEYYLNEKIKAIHQELGRKDDRTDEVEELKKKIETAGHAQGSPREGRAGAEAARGDAAGLGRGDRLAQLHRVARRACPGRRPRASSKDLDARRADPERGPLRAREGQGADPRVPGRAPARPEDEGLDHLLRRPSGRRQDVARQVDRPVAQPQVRAPVARRRARRGGDPRPPPHLHRRLPRPDHPDDEEGGHGQPRLPARRGGQDVARTSGATRRRRCSRSSTRSRTTPSSTTTSTSSTTSRRSCSSPRPTSPTRSRRP